MVEKLEKWSPIFIALIALTFSLYEGCENREERRRSREQQRIATQPRMVLNYRYRFTTPDESELEYIFMNVGLGPAEVKWFSVRVDGKEQKNWNEMFKALGLNYEAPFSVPGNFYPSAGGGTILKIGPGRIAVAFELKRHRIDMSACYCSVYQAIYSDKCWIMDITASERKPVDTCLPAPKVKFSAPLPFPEDRYPPEAKMTQ